MAAAATSQSAPAVQWAPCVGFPGYECASYPVPLDYDNPKLGTIRLALVRRPASNPSQKIGSLFLNPGGPGGAGLAFARAAARVLFNDEIRAKFDIVGFDPRGVGQSAGIQCFASDAEFEAVLGPVPSMPLSRQEIRTTLAAYRTWTSACDRNARPLIEHMSTLNVVRDLDVLRRAVGDRQLTYAGYSYGTLIGATYANLYPGRVRALLLDGMVDPAERTQRSLLNELNRAGGFETALRGFLDLCASSGAACVFSAGGNPKAKYDRLRERLRQGPLTLPDGSAFTISNLTDFVGGELYDAAEFPTLAGVLQALYEIAFGAPAAVRAAGTPALDKARDASRWRSLADAYSYNGADALYAVNCVDKRLPRRQAVWPAIAKGFELVHRNFGRWQAYGAAVCATWPVVTNERYAGPWNRRSANTVLVVGTYFDPATPYVFAQRATRQLGNARLLSLNGYGHTSILSSKCIDEKTNNYILTTQVPPAGTLCQADASPFGTPTAAAKAGVPELAGRS